VHRIALALAVLLALFRVEPLPAQQANQDLGAVADRVFADFNSTRSPGCAVGVARNSETLLTRGYGMANHETGTPITAATVFESGSVAKQFTAAAVLLLATDGKLNLDDPVRKYIPELPSYDRPILVRHLLSHTSGLREWSNLVGISGWPRGSRVHTQDDLLEVVVAQKQLNYPVGDHYSYTNSGFALLVTIIERVSGMPFTRFTAERLFQPLGMTSTGWRDDFTTLVPGRAQAYSRTGGGFRLNMPFENVVGPGGMLTTVGDWLTWNDHLDRKTLGAVVDSLEQRAVLTNGRRIPYARGLVVSDFRGTREVAHSGSTGGYSTYLTRFPEHRLSVAVLCNVAGAGATGYARAIAAALIPNLAPAPGPDTVATDPGVAARLSGVYQSLRTHEPLLVGMAAAGRGGRGGGSGLRSLRDGGYLVGNTRVVFDVAPDGSPRGLRRLPADGDTVAYAFVSATPWTPAPQELTAFEGRYRSDEVNATYQAAVENGRLVLRLRAGVRRELTPIYKDAFTGGGGLGTIWFTRDTRGRVTAMHSGSARLWDLAFRREASSP
jgi:CubicO group peptidase (beta-lactamase class C family)